MDIPSIVCNMLRHELEAQAAMEIYSREFGQIYTYPEISVTSVTV